METTFIILLGKIIELLGGIRENRKRGYLNVKGTKTWTKDVKNFY